MICLIFAAFTHLSPSKAQGMRRTFNQSLVVRDVTTRCWCTSADVEYVEGSFLWILNE